MKYLVTGSSSGLGYALCQRLLMHGDVLGLSRTLRRASDLSCPFRYTHLSCDFSDSTLLENNSSFCRELFDFLQDDEFSLILNAASFYSSTIRLPGNELDSLFAVNVLSAIKLVNLLQTPRLRRILFVNSVSGLVGQVSQHEYASSKHALMGFSKSLSKSAKNSTFDVMCINPGGMKTELWGDYSDVDTSDFLSPSMVASLCEYLLLLPGRMFIQNFVILPPSDV